MAVLQSGIQDRKESGDEYNVRGYDGGASMDRLLTVEGFNHKYIYISLLFPKQKKNVKEIDLLELPHAKDKELLPSNDDGKAKSYFNIRVKDYQVSSGKKNKKVYFQFKITSIEIAMTDNGLNISCFYGKHNRHNNCPLFFYWAGYFWKSSFYFVYLQENSDE